MKIDILVFSTTIETVQEVRKLAPFLNVLAGWGNWNFALDDCDRVLRVHSTSIDSRQIIRLLESRGFRCTELEDVIPGPLAIQTETAA